MKFLLFILFLGILAQLSGQYLGGSKDGYDIAKYNNSFNLYAGGNSDGYDKSKFQNTSSIYTGGENDGYDNAGFQNSFSIYAGGKEDGYDHNSFKNLFTIFSGGNKDGYDKASMIISFIWTGASDTGWNVAGNWLNLQIPDITSRVVIPSRVSNYPYINDGLMSIGQNLNGGIYLCKQINVKEGAEMTFNLNTTVENYGLLNIKGSVFVLNPIPGTFKNLSDGKINLESGSILELKN